MAFKPFKNSLTFWFFISRRQRAQWAHVIPLPLVIQVYKYLQWKYRIDILFCILIFCTCLLWIVMVIDELMEGLNGHRCIDGNVNFHKVSHYWSRYAYDALQNDFHRWFQKSAIYIQVSENNLCYLFLLKNKVWNLYALWLPSLNIKLFNLCIFLQSHLLDNTIAQQAFFET